MLKELKYLFFLIITSLFFYLIIKYYFSDENIRKSYRATKLFENRNFVENKKLNLLESDTDEFIEIINNKKNDKKKFRFWELIEND